MSVRSTRLEAGNFRQRMLDLAAEYEALRLDREALRLDRDKLLTERGDRRVSLRPVGHRASHDGIKPVRQSFLSFQHARSESAVPRHSNQLVSPFPPNQVVPTPVPMPAPVSPASGPPGLLMDPGVLMDHTATQPELVIKTRLNGDIERKSDDSDTFRSSIAFQSAAPVHSFPSVDQTNSMAISKLLSMTRFKNDDPDDPGDDTPDLFASVRLGPVRREVPRKSRKTTTRKTTVETRVSFGRNSTWTGVGVASQGTGFSKRGSAASTAMQTVTSAFFFNPWSTHESDVECKNTNIDVVIDVNETKRRPLRRATVSCSDWLLGTQRGQWLFLLILGSCIISTGALVWRLFGGNEEFDRSWNDSFWISYCLFIDPGTQTGIPASDPERIKLTASLLSLVGFCFNLSFLGMIVELVKGVLTRWKKERYRIVLTGHVLILGWTDKTLFLLAEMLKQAAYDGRQVVILAMRDEHEMMQDIRHHIGGRTRLLRHVRVCQGCPFDVEDLVRVSAGSAADVLVLGRKGSNSNLEMVRVLVALAALPQEVTGKVFAEVWDADAEPVLEVLLSNTNGISARPPVRRLFCLMVVQPIIANCMISLCSVEAPEELRMVKAASHLIGRNFGDACRSFTSDVCIGVKAGDCRANLVPDEDYIISPDDQVILLGRRKQNSHVKEQAMFPIADDRDIMICCGWSEDFVELMCALDGMVSHTCIVYVLSEKPEDERSSALAQLELRNLTLCHHVGSCRSVQQLAALPLHDASVIMVLAEAGTHVQSNALDDDNLAQDDAITADSACLTVMVTITGIVEGLYGHERHRGKRARIICDVFDPRTDHLLARNSALQEHAVFFRSNALETALFRTAAENPVAFNALNEMLCTHEGATMHLISADNYVSGRHSFAEHMEPGELLGDEEGLSYWEVHKRVRNGPEGGLLIGWLRLPQAYEDCDDSTRHSSVVIAPPINRNKKLLWRCGDHFLVLKGAEKRETEHIPFRLSHYDSSQSLQIEKTIEKTPTLSLVGSGTDDKTLQESMPSSLFGSP